MILESDEFQGLDVATSISTIPDQIEYLLSWNHAEVIVIFGQSRSTLSSSELVLARIAIIKTIERSSNPAVNRATFKPRVLDPSPLRNRSKMPRDRSRSPEHRRERSSRDDRESKRKRRDRSRDRYGSEDGERSRKEEQTIASLSEVGQKELTMDDYL